MADAPREADLSRRERQVMDTLYALREGTARDVVEAWSEEEAYDSVRVIMANLWKDGYLRREREGRAYVYSPAVPPRRAARRKLTHLLETYFPDSPSMVVRTFLDVAEDELTEEELDEISGWIESRKRSRGA